MADIPSEFRYLKKCPMLSTSLLMLLGFDDLNDATIASNVTMDKPEKLLIPFASKQLQSFLIVYEMNSFDLLFKCRFVEK